MVPVAKIIIRRAVQGDALNLENKPPASKPGSGRRDDGAVRDREMGEALRSVYDKAVQESVPDEMLDLLSKLD